MSAKQISSPIIKGFSFKENCIEILDEKSKQFMTELFGNENIKREMKKILIKTNIITPNEIITNNENNNFFNFSSEDLENELSEQSNIVMKEEGKDEMQVQIQPLRKFSGGENKNGLVMLLKQSVFSELNENPNHISSTIFSRNPISTSSITNWRKKKLGMKDDNGNVGSPPVSNTIWGTVKAWISKAVQKIRDMTSNLLGKSSNLLTQFGLLILGVSVLFTAGIITTPSYYFTKFLNILLSFF